MILNMSTSSACAVVDVLQLLRRGVVTTVVVVNDLAEVLIVLLLLLSEIGFLFPVCLFHRLPRLHALRDSFFRVVALHWLVTWHYEDLWSMRGHTLSIVSQLLINSRTPTTIDGLSDTQSETAPGQYGKLKQTKLHNFNWLVGCG